MDSWGKSNFIVFRFLVVAESLQEDSPVNFTNAESRTGGSAETEINLFARLISDFKF